MLNYDTFVGRRGPYVVIKPGVAINLLDPQPELLDLPSIARALANTCRFGGHCRFYSVAEHSLHVAELARVQGFGDEIQCVALLHDAAEAYIGDIITQLKALLPDIKPIEARFNQAIAARFGLDFTSYWKCVHVLDTQVLAAEKAAIWPDDTTQWQALVGVQKPDITLNYWSPAKAARKFSAVAQSLGLV